MIKITNLPPNNSGALTLSVDCLKGEHGGWRVAGEIHYDYYKWVNGFAAVKGICGEIDVVCGDFEKTVWATSQEAYEDFIKNCPPESWDYRDI